MPRYAKKESVSTLVSLSSKVIAKHEQINYVKHTHLMQHVLPQAPKEYCATYLKEKGPSFWKELDIVSDAKKHETVQLLMLMHPSLQLLLPIYFYLWNQEVEHVPVHIYEMGWGHCLQPGAKSAHHMYLESLNVGQGKKPMLVSPLLAHEHHYFPYNQNYNTEAHSSNEGPEHSINDTPPKDIYYIKLFCAEACAKRDRWSESFAHAMSALDHHKDNFPYVHNLFCQLALAAGKMSLKEDWWLDFLLKAQEYDYFIYNKWRRVVVFHNIATHHGLFDMEKKVFLYGLDNIPMGSGFRMQLLTQHIQALMAQIENNAAYQFLRIVYHENCNSHTCEKPIYYQYSYAKNMSLITEMEQCLHQLPEEGHRHYFQGYAYLYKTWNSVFDDPNERDHSFMKGAMALFDLAELDLADAEMSAIKKDLELIREALKKRFMCDESICESYSAMTNMDFNVEAANTCFRIALVDMYWTNIITGAKAPMLCQTAHKCYKKSTMYRGYREMLLLACYRYLELGIIGHDSDGAPEEDYPPIECMTASQELIESVNAYWTSEMQCEPKQTLFTKKCELTSFSILENSQECMELYAFGADIFSKLVEPYL